MTARLHIVDVRRCRLRSADTLALCRIVDRSFAVPSPKLWNGLTGQLRQPDVELGQSKRPLRLRPLAAVL